MPESAAGTPLHIITLVKWVPDAQLERRFTAERRIDRSEGILGELDEYPLEAALQIKEAASRDVRVSALTIGPAGAATAAKKALQIGADDAFHLSDDALTGADVVATSAALAAAIEHVLADGDAEGEHLVITGMASEDGESGAVPPQLAERLGLNLVTQATAVALEEDRLVVTRASATEQQRLAAALPAVVSVTDQANEPRYPNFKAIMAAKKKPMTSWSLADVGLDASAVASKATVLTAEARPPRTAGEIITDEGDAGVKIVEFLAKERVL
ncbi:MULTISPECIES: electron transfer flavoprotein subunit beta/FixA family protein [unclassified Nesterenkonia]|uniref:electron transfer flavoprotein subunit beta/FixA family protein n=1 Tax=unclassified Nesterenkonia TaxID=2629769 RepID=UPI000AA1654D|nr:MULTISPECIES: electron transfer flavoprotein subunit beta/FixA family protein [unclassified Nesterenkonia]MDS2172776.1 electron transfer flavoprotein subunit beta/FixA family protein [Nesterenkonia sp. CL21]